MRRKLIVIGGAGYIGSSLVPLLLERDYEVEVVDLLWFGRHLPEKVKVRQMDALDISKGDLEGADQVIFLGGLSNDPMAEYSPSKNFIYNAAMPGYLGYIAKQAGVRRFVYACSCSVYGYTANELCDETAVATPSYPYGISKLQGEQALLQMVDENFSVVSLRKGTVSGHSPRMRFDLVVNTMFMNAVTRNEIVINNPAIWRPILSIDDAVTAYIRAVEADLSISGIFNVVSGNYTIGEVGDTVKHQMDRMLNKNIKLVIKHITDYRNYKVAYSNAANILSFKPKHTLENIVETLIGSRSTYGDFSDANYYNIQTFKRLDQQMAVPSFHFSRRQP